MNRIARISLATGLLSVAALGATAANAQVFGSVSINLPGPPVAVLPAPPVHVRPAQPIYYGHDRGHYRHEDRDYRYQDRGYRYQDRGYRDGRGYYGTRWDRDGDGVPNRHDRRPMNPYRY